MKFVAFVFVLPKVSVWSLSLVIWSESVCAAKYALSYAGLKEVSVASGLKKMECQAQRTYYFRYNLFFCLTLGEEQSQRRKLETFVAYTGRIPWEKNTPRKLFPHFKRRLYINYIKKGKNG